jgi:hypothetical protein
MQQKSLVVVIGILFGLALPATAHHAIQAQFDFDKPIQIKGTLARVEWINPHAYFVLDVSGPNGQKTSWMLETFGPGALRRAGMSRVGFFKVGEIYTVNGFASKDKSPSGWVKDLTGPDGKTVTIWFGDLNDRR